MKYLVGAVGLLIILSSAVIFFLYTGWYDVAATTPHWGLTAWLLGGKCGIGRLLITARKPRVLH